MILVDKSIWIDHLHTAEAHVVSLWPTTKLAAITWSSKNCRSIKQRDVVLDLLSNLHRFPTVTQLEILHLVEGRQLWGRGLSATDVNLLGAVALVEGAKLWTRDKRLKAVCTEVGVPVVDEP